MTRMGKDRGECLSLMEQKIASDLSALLECEVKVRLFTSAQVAKTLSENSLEGYKDILDFIPQSRLDAMEFNDYSSNPGLIECITAPKASFSVAKDDSYETAVSAFSCHAGEISNANQTVIKFKSDLLRSNCRVTHQPDWGTVYVSMVCRDGCPVPTYESLLRYIVSHRSVFHFHEEICEMIYKHLLDICEPQELMVACCYTRRGGIDINPVRVSSRDLIPTEFSSPNILLSKTYRQ
ncbi:MAG: hypothetical protein HUJ95_05495 [Bacteroidales bacterium]|nr:hypothetical protein [Bacteroidales bacterium]